jgi:hypothetical protein
VRYAPTSASAPPWFEWWSWGRFSCRRRRSVSVVVVGPGPIGATMSHAALCESGGAAEAESARAGQGVFFVSSGLSRGCRLSRVIESPTTSTCDVPHDTGKGSKALTNPLCPRPSGRPPRKEPSHRTPCGVLSRVTPPEPASVASAIACLWRWQKEPFQERTAAPTQKGAPKPHRTRLAASPLPATSSVTQSQRMPGSMRTPGCGHREDLISTAHCPLIPG